MPCSIFVESRMQRLLLVGVGQAQNTLVSLLDNAGIELAESQGFVNDLHQPLAKLMEKDVRIILASFNATWARRVFCAVYRTSLYGRHHQWIIAGPRQSSWWKEEDPSVNCTVLEILTALEGAFVVDVLPLTSSKEPTISGLVSFLRHGAGPVRTTGSE